MHDSISYARMPALVDETYHLPRRFTDSFGMSLLTLPVSIFGLIFANIDTLHGHVNIALTSRILWQRYVASDFFEQACRVLGYALPATPLRTGWVCRHSAALAVALCRTPLVQQLDTTRGTQTCFETHLAEALYAAQYSATSRISTIHFLPLHPLDTRCIDTAPVLSRPILLFARLSAGLPAAWTDTDSLNFLNVDGINVGSTGSDVVLHNMLDITGDCVVLFYASA